MLFSAPIVLAFCIAVATDTDEPTLVIENARVIVGDGQVRECASVVIRGKRIESVTDGVVETHSAIKIDGRGMTLLPGLIDVHVHVLGLDPNVEGGRGEKAFRADFANDLPRRLEQFLRHGVTTVKSVGELSGPILELRVLLEAGKLRGPRLIVAGPCFTAPDGHPASTIDKDDPWVRAEHCIEADTPAEAVERVRCVAAAGVDAIKLVYQGGPYPEYYDSKIKIVKLRKDVMEAIIEESHRQRLRATVHTWHEEDVLEVLEAGADGVEHGALSAVLTNDRVAKALRVHDAFYVPTLRILTLSRDPATLEIGMANLKILAEQGVRIAVGTDTIGRLEATPPGMNTIQELELMVKAGMSPGQVIQGGTRNAAEYLGLLGDLGTVEPGKIADLIIVDGDPLKDISALRRQQIVIQSGHIVYKPDIK